jgi:hypothetical protein
VSAEEFARLLNARRVKRGAWVAKCPSHPDRTHRSPFERESAPLSCLSA